VTPGKLAHDWDTFGLFEQLWEDRDRLLDAAGSLRSDNVEDTLEIKLAIVGFALFSTVEEWDYRHYEIIHHRLQTELSPEALDDEGEDTQAYARFACLALGAMLGKYDAGQIDDAGFFLGDAHLAGFLMLNMVKMYTFGHIL
jgi:hypothetical protein